MKNFDYKKNDSKVDKVSSYGKGGSQMLNYSFKPEPTFIEKKGASARCFLGIELEYACKNTEEEEDFNLFDFVEGIYRFNDFEKLFYTKHDSSFFGPEFVFQPISFLGIVELYRQGFWHRFFEMKDEFYKSTKNTGLHVHLDKDLGYEDGPKGRRLNQNMFKISYSIFWLFDNFPDIFKSIVKRSTLEYCTPYMRIEKENHTAAINETSHTYEIRFWGSPVSVERFMYCLAATKAIDIVSRSDKFKTKEEILEAIFWSIPKKIEEKFKIKMSFPKKMSEFRSVISKKPVKEVVEIPEKLNVDNINRVPTVSEIESYFGSIANPSSSLRDTFTARNAILTAARRISESSDTPLLEVMQSLAARVGNQELLRARPETPLLGLNSEGVEMPALRNDDAAEVAAFNASYLGTWAEGGIL